MYAVLALPPPEFSVLRGLLVFSVVVFNTTTTRRVGNFPSSSNLESKINSTYSTEKEIVHLIFFFSNQT